MDEWGLVVSNEIRVGTRYNERSGKERVIDLAVSGRGVRLKCRVREGIVRLDHKPLEREIEVERWLVKDKGWKRGGVDWKKFRSELKVWGGKGVWLKDVTWTHVPVAVSRAER